MKTRLYSLISIVLLGVLTFSLIGDVNTVQAASVCNGAQFVADVTIPDGTYIQPGASFTKIWRLKNVGTCSWTTSYALVFVSGERMGALSPIFFPRYVSTNQTVDVTVPMTAPTVGGSYRGYWKLQNGSGTQFGIGGGFSNPFWVDIRVLAPTQGTVAYDFVAEMCSGNWGYDGGPIPCPVNNSKKDFGYVLKLDNPVLETGQPAGAPGLLTIPQNKFNGAIHGAFPVDEILRGDHFQAIIGCQYQAVNCAVTYQIDILTNNGMDTIWKFKEQYDGLYYQVDLDLSPVANRKNAQLVLSVYAAGPSVGDQPLWVAPRIVRNVNVPGPTATPTPAPGTPTATPTVTGTVTPITPTATPTNVGGATNTPTPTGTVTPTTPTPTPVPGCTDRAQFISDITVPDGTTFAPNAPFTKTWRLRNAGTCTWTTGYSLTFVSGDRMGGVDTLIPQTAVPGQTVDVGVNLTAPGLAGSYRGYWELKNASGAVFGIGTSFDRPFYVDIRVSGSSSGSTAFDFVNSVCTAQWSSGAGALPCPGTDGDSRGFVLNVTNPVLENGVADPHNGLLTYPQSVFNGYIQGVYPAFAVQSGDHFQATLNCQYGAADCFVIFRLDAQVAGVTQNLLSIGERYDGLYYVVDVDLSSLAGKNVNFVLSLLANGDATGDRGMWVGPRILRTGGGSVVSTSTPTQAAATATPTQPPATGTPTSTPTQAPATSTPTPTVAPPTNTPTPTAVPVTPTPTAFASGWNLYRNTKYAFAFQIPPGSTIISQADNGGRVNLPFVSGTNLHEKYLDLSIIEGAGTCKSPYSNPMESSQNLTINGIQFLKEASSEGALSNIYDWTAYSTAKGNACISFTFILHSVNPGVFETPPPVFDPVAESAIFSTIMSTYGNQ